MDKLKVTMQRLEDNPNMYSVSNPFTFEFFFSDVDNCLDAMNLWNKGEDIFGRVTGYLYQVDIVETEEIEEVEDGEA